MRLKYSKEDDVLMIWLNDKKVDYAEQNGDLIVHFSPDREAVLLEFLNAKKFLRNINEALPKQVKENVFTRSSSAVAHRIK